MLKNLTLCFFVFNHSVFASGAIKIALLDNLQSEKLATERYITDYREGIDLGVELAKGSEIAYEVREFYYGKNNLEILPQVEAIKT